MSKVVICKTYIMVNWDVWTYDFLKGRPDTVKMIEKDLKKDQLKKFRVFMYRHFLRRAKVSEEVERSVKWRKKRLERMLRPREEEDDDGYLSGYNSDYHDDPVLNGDYRNYDDC